MLGQLENSIEPRQYFEVLLKTRLVVWLVSLTLEGLDTSCTSHARDIYRVIQSRDVVGLQRHLKMTYSWAKFFAI